MGLLGWGAAGGGAASVGSDNAELESSFFSKLDQCLDVDLKSEAGKGKKYVVVSFGKTSKTVTEAKVFDALNFGRVDAADYNTFARVAGARAAHVQEPSIAETVARSGLAQHGSCGAEACCIKFN